MPVTGFVSEGRGFTDFNEIWSTWSSAGVKAWRWRIIVSNSTCTNAVPSPQFRVTAIVQARLGNRRHVRARPPTPTEAQGAI
jgi:hypothetical protein